MTRSLPRSVRSHLRWLRGQPGEPGFSGEEPDATLCLLIRLLDYCAELTGDDAYLEGITARIEVAAPRAGQETAYAAAYLAALSSHTRVAGVNLAQQAEVAVATIAAACDAEPAPGLIKPAAVLFEASAWLDRDGPAAKTGKLAEELLGGAGDPGTTLAALADTAETDEVFYDAVEGLVLLREQQARFVPENVLLEAAERLAASQTGSGGVVAVRETAGDLAETAAATARAVRVWQCVDEHCYSLEIRKGLSFLRGLAARGGGFCTAPGSDRIDAASTVYAAQAMLWQRGRVEPAWLI